MQESHVTAILELERKSNAAPWSETSFRAELKNNQARYFVATEDKQVIGFAGYWSIVDEAHVTTIAVHPDHRKQGIGEQLMITLLKDAKQKGLSCSTLEVRASNEAAITLYEKLGYVRCGVRRGYYPNNREDAVVMWLYGIS